MSYSYGVPLDYRDNYAEHAAPQSIVAMLTLVRQDLDKARREERWLTELAEERAEQVARGEWP